MSPVAEKSRIYVAMSLPVAFAQVSTSGQFHAGRPPTVHDGSGSRSRKRQTSTVSRFTPSRAAISGMPTGSQIMKATVAKVLTTDQRRSDTHYMTSTNTTAAATQLACGIAGVREALETNRRKAGVDIVQRLYRCDNGWQLGARRGGPLDLADEDSWEIFVLDERGVVSGESAGWVSDETLALAVQRLTGYSARASA